MAFELLSTKTHRPPERRQWVERPRLLESLDRAVREGARLILLSAPPGFGKTALAAAWLAHSRAPSAWLSLDAADNDAARFFRYLVAALRALAPELGEAVLAALAAPAPPGPESLCTLLLNDLDRLPGPAALVLDDMHVIEAPGLHRAVEFLVDHLPERVHLVIATRVDPPLPLARYRSRRELAEVRTDDLRFAPAEAAEFLCNRMGLPLEPADSALLANRTEGWIAGLQLAALSLEGHGNPHRFVESFSGSHRFVLDYLVEEVLSRQPEHVLEFLLCTSLLERLAGPLCDAVTGWSDGQAVLEALERRNLFLVPLDDERRWYRYHHLFADLLRTRLGQWPPERVRGLHRRAAEWHMTSGSLEETVHHALAAQDFEMVAGVLERHHLMLDGLASPGTYIGWMRAIPAGDLRRHPVLCLRYASALTVTGHLEDAGEWIREAEQHLKEHPDPDPERARAQAVLCGHVRGYYGSFLGEYDTAIEHAETAMEQVRPDDVVMRSIFATLLGTLYAAVGDLDRAGGWHREAIALHAELQHVYPASMSYVSLIDMAMVQGRLGAAEKLCRESLSLIQEQGERPPGIGGMAEVLLADILRERDELGPARELALKGVEHTRLVGQPGHQALAHGVLAQVLLAMGDLCGAQDCLREGETVARRHAAMPLVDAILQMVSVPVWLAGGDLPAAQRWAAGRGLDPAALPDDYLREPEYLPFVRVLLAQGRTDEALGALDQLQANLAAHGRTGRLIEALSLQASALAKRNQAAQALGPLRRALVLAEPEGYARVFLDEGAALAPLLRRLAAEGQDPRVQSYAARLVQALPGQAAPRPAASALVEPLSAREREVLRLLCEGLSNREIAGRLVISVATAKKHVQNIYGKLEVENRGRAIRRAQELGLL